MAPRPRLLLVQLCAVAAAASCLLAATSTVVDAALLPPPPPRDASATTGDTDAPRTVAGDGVAAAGVSRGARRLGPPHRLRALSDIPAADARAPAAAADDNGIPADAPAPAAAGHSPWTFIEVAFGLFLFLLAAFGGVLVVVFLVAGLIKGVALLASAVADLYAAAKRARERTTRVRPVDQLDAGH
ncbi:unnamed protein product [Urochloa decumbens]|uniref:Uncharacterized protein n=1 Tax=Urochloa decumbens TaxID=240449 RepID=A0ABC8ZZT9_9POAL